VDFIKPYIKRMELEALEGAHKTIERSHPIFPAESIKADRERLRSLLGQCGYKVVEADINLLAIY
jgi:hypothetical protein